MTASTEMKVTLAVLESLAANERRIEAAGWKRTYDTHTDFPLWTHPDYPHAVFATDVALALTGGALSDDAI